MDVAENYLNKTLFISRASQMDREIPKEIFKFFDTQFILNILPMNDAKIEYYFKNYKTELLEALKIADSDIVDLSIKKEIVPVTRLDFAKGENLHLKTNISNQMEEMVIIGCFHRNAPNVVFDFLTEESSGTIKMFFALLTILDIVKENKILLIDELEEKLHTHIVEFIIKLFNKSEKAQLIYTTHNTNLLDLKKVRKDQIIFCNIKEDASTEVYSLYDFKDFREGMDLEKAYLQGRFDAIPFINDSEENIKQLIYE